MRDDSSFFLQTVSKDEEGRQNESDSTHRKIYVNKQETSLSTVFDELKNVSLFSIDNVNLEDAIGPNSRPGSPTSPGRNTGSGNDPIADPHSSGYEVIHYTLGAARKSQKEYEDTMRRSSRPGTGEGRRRSSSNSRPGSRGPGRASGGSNVVGQYGAELDDVNEERSSTPNARWSCAQQEALLY
jgi:hypothetical protein